jgi:hypothetical protein
MHWYNSLGEPCYDTGLREARKIGLLPSVTSVEKVIDNPGLEIWKQNQILEASLTLTRDLEETDSEFIARVKADSMAQTKKAAKLGTVVHHLAERYIMGKDLFYYGKRSDVWEVFRPLRDWIDTHISKPDTGFMSEDGAEVVRVNANLGYAGKADFIGYDKNNVRVLVDFKTTFLKPSDIKKDNTLKKAKLYDSWIRQLSALNCAGPMVSELLSVVISTNKDFPGVWVHNWDDDAILKGWREFRNALELFKSIKGL